MHTRKISGVPMQPPCSVPMALQTLLTASSSQDVCPGLSALMLSIDRYRNAVRSKLCSSCGIFSLLFGSHRARKNILARWFASDAVVAMLLPTARRSNRQELRDPLVESAKGAEKLQ